MLGGGGEKRVKRRGRRGGGEAKKGDTAKMCVQNAGVLISSHTTIFISSMKNPPPTCSNDVVCVKVDLTGVGAIYFMAVMKD